MMFVAETGTNHVVVMDGAPEGGGRNLAPRPMELVLAGAGGCSAYDVVLILKRGRHSISTCEVTLTAERASDDPKVFTHVHMRYRLTGRDLRPDAVERAIRLSAEKYCSATAMLSKTAQFSYDWEVTEG
jgi:putative redox protein